jgi:hypothetical protein
MITQGSRGPLIVLAAAFLSVAVVLPLAAADRAALAAAAGETLQKALQLYAAGSYQDCRDVVGPFLAGYEAAPASYPSGTVARLYRLQALLTYTFREEGYAEEISALLGKAVVLDIDLEIGDPAEVPAFVIDTFTKLRNAYLARFARTARRNAVGVFGALVLEPTVFQNLSLLQPGVEYTFNLNGQFSLDAQLRFPLQLPLWNSIRGQVGVLWFPSFRVEKIATGLSLAYIFGIDDLSTFTGSLSFGGRMELVSRSGFAVAGTAELLRADLVFGNQAPTPPPSYTQIPFLGVGRIVFANITLAVYYVFP